MNRQFIFVCDSEEKLAFARDRCLGEGCTLVEESEVAEVRLAEIVGASPYEIRNRLVKTGQRRWVVRGLVG